MVGDQPLNSLARPLSAKVDFAHVADIEHADSATRGLVFFENPSRIVDRHHPATEVNQFGAQTPMFFEQRCLLWGIGAWGLHGRADHAKKVGPAQVKPRKTRLPGRVDAGRG